MSNLAPLSSAHASEAAAPATRPRGPAHGAEAEGTQHADAASEAAGEDSAELSPTGLAALEAEEAGPAAGLTPEEASQVRELQARDREVRAHEAAHKSAAGGLATGAPSFQTQRGPDGVSYAVGGEVGISTSEGRTPEETLQRAQLIQRAALAPAQPSSQDRAVAARAAQMAASAKAEIAAERNEPDESSESGHALAAYAQAGPLSEANGTGIDVTA